MRELFDIASMSSIGPPAMRPSATRDLSALGASTGTSFADQLQASFRDRATALGLTLPAADAGAGAVPSTAMATPDSATAAWQRAQLQSLANGNGPGDAMLKSLADAASARYERQRSPRGMFDGM